MSALKFLGTLTILTLAFSAFADTTQHGKHFDRAITVIFENENFATILKESFFKELADKGANFTNFIAEAHPSQPNYIALTSGSTNGVVLDDLVDVNANNIVDLLEAKGISWKVYAEAFPGNCFTGEASATYARKHNPFMSYVNIQNNKTRCANVVNADQFDSDAANGKLPQYIFYVPDMNNDGHDTDVSYANKWYEAKFSKYVNDDKFMADTVLITTFDESGLSWKNHTYTSVVGSTVKVATVSDDSNHYSLLKMIEDNWELGDLGKEDKATLIPNIW